jgi:ABC-type transport system involved in multi-copper enzyme maturation permease subunit
MNTIKTIAWLTFHEAWRRWMVLLALLLSLVFVLLYSIGFWLVTGEVEREQAPMVVHNQIHNVLLLAGLYVVHFLTIMIAIFASVDTISGEIATHTIQALVIKPVQRWQIVVGKWLGYAAMLMVYIALLSGGIMLSTYLQSGYLPPNALQGLLLLALEGLVLLSLSLLGGTRLSTLTNGVALFMLYGLAFIGTWVEQIGSIFQSEAAVRVGIITSLIMPVESLWRRAAYLLQPTVIGSTGFSPFSAFSVPSPAMVIYAMLYAGLALLLALRSFNRRDL